MRVVRHGLTILLFLSISVFAGLSGCATAKGSAVITGVSRVEIAPSEVKLYLEAPPEYETIGLVEASCAIEFSAQEAADKTMAELKAQAAKIGANGILLLNVDEQAGDSVGVISFGMVVPISSKYRVAKGKAILVGGDGDSTGQ